MNRREILKGLSIIPFGLLADSAFLNLFGKDKSGQVNDSFSEKTISIFNSIIKSANDNNWHKLPIGKLIGNVALKFIETPYVAGTLDYDMTEACRINLEGLDCVTFFENSLCLARIIKKKKTTFNDLISEVTLTRYRSGVLNGYTSRLHYTSEWISDNVKKGVVEDISRKTGGMDFPVNVFFMSQNPHFYKQLKGEAALVSDIKKIEKQINQEHYYYTPKKLAVSNQKRLLTGDIIAISTSKKGLDYSHTGLIFFDEDKQPHFLNASSKKKKVVMGPPLAEYLQSVESDTGYSVARPLEPN